MVCIYTLSFSDKSDDPIETLNEFAKTKPTNEVLSAQIRKVQAEEKWNEEQVAQVAFYLLFDAAVLDQLKIPSKLALLKEVRNTNYPRQFGQKFR